MALFGWFKKKDNRNNYAFDDDDRKASKEIREKRKEIELLKLEREFEMHKLRMEREKLQLQRDIEDIQAEFEDDEPIAENESTETALLKIFGPMIAQKIMNSNSVVADSPPLNVSPSPPQQPQNTFSDDELRQIWEQTPKMARKMAKNYDDDTIRKVISNKLNITDKDTLDRALRIVRES